MAEEVAVPAAPVAAAPAPQRFVIPDTPAPAASSPAPAEAAPEGGEKPAPSASAPEKAEEKAETPEQAEKRGSRRFERKLDKAHRRAAEAEAKASFFEKQLAERAAAKEQPEDAGAPKLEQFNDIEKYAQAKAKYESQKALEQHEAQQQTKAQKESQEKLQSRWETLTSKADSKYDDFDDIVGDIKPTTPWAMAIMDADNGDDIAYFLGKNLDEAKRIANLPAHSQIREIGKLEHKLAAEPQKPKQPSKAPAPVTPLSGAAQVDPTTPSEKDDMKDWLRKRNKQVHGARVR